MCVLVLFIGGLHLLIAKQILSICHFSNSLNFLDKFVIDSIDFLFWYFYHIEKSAYIGNTDANAVTFYLICLLILYEFWNLYVDELR